MLTPRIVRLAALALAPALALGLAAAAPAAGGPAPVVTLKATVSPPTDRLRPHTPFTVVIDNAFKSIPPGGTFVLQSFDYLFPRGAVTNGRLFPSCSVARLRAAHGDLRACPKGSKIGSGVATGTAVALGITSSGKVTLFNGPGGRSITMNVHVVRPADINTTWTAVFAKTHGRYVLKLSANVPDELKSVLDSPIVVSRIHVTTGATRIVAGVRRGYTEAVHCPKGGKAPFHGDFVFDGGVKAIAC